MNGFWRDSSCACHVVVNSSSKRVHRHRTIIDNVGGQGHMSMSWDPLKLIRKEDYFFIYIFLISRLCGKIGLPICVKLIQWFM